MRGVRGLRRRRRPAPVGAAVAGSGVHGGRALVALGGRVRAAWRAACSRLARRLRDVLRARRRRRRRSPPARASNRSNVVRLRRTTFGCASRRPSPQPRARAPPWPPRSRRCRRPLPRRRPRRGLRAETEGQAGAAPERRAAAARRRAAPSWRRVRRAACGPASSTPRTREDRRAARPARSVGSSPSSCRESDELRLGAGEAALELLAERSAGTKDQRLDRALRSSSSDRRRSHPCRERPSSSRMASAVRCGKVSTDSARAGCPPAV